MRKCIQKIATSPYLNLISGIILLGFSLTEILQTLETDAKIGAHHGVLLYSIIQLIKVIPEFMKGMQSINMANTQ